MKLIDSHHAFTTHDPKTVFSLWSDPASWPNWDAEVREVHFAGPTKVGAQGKMRPASGPAAKFSITALEQDHILTNASSLPGATLIFEHKVTLANGGSDIAVTVSASGPLSTFWQRVLRKNMSGAARSSVVGLLNHLDAA
ncbi:SRPBCC family protein [Leucobacter sp. 1207-22]|uniref:SRPBCC family protein n=1 Tax=Leucobacter sp. 1207-22 TaxID=2604456 RepID=UPI004064BCA5